MRKHLLTVALAIVALGGAVASTAPRSSAPVLIRVGPEFSTTTPECDERNVEDCALTGSIVPCTIEDVPYDLHQDLGTGPDAGTCAIPLYYIGK